MQESADRIFYDNDVTSRVLAVIRGAEKHLVLVSPYVDEVGHVQQALLRAKQKGVEITILVRKDASILGGNNGQAAITWFAQHSIPVVGVPNLHAKFYLNETEGVVTSMNLLRSSWSNSLEFGVTVSGSDHRNLVNYYATLKGLAQFAPESPKPDTSLPEDKPTEGRSRYPTGHRRRMANATRPDPVERSTTGRLGSLINVVRELVAPQGFCIRCRDRLSADDVKAGKVLCASDYRSWARYSDGKYAEKYCTRCGEKSTTSYDKPLCNSCYFNA